MNFKSFLNKEKFLFLLYFIYIKEILILFLNQEDIFELNLKEKDKIKKIIYFINFLLNFFLKKDFNYYLELDKKDFLIILNTKKIKKISLNSDIIDKSIIEIYFSKFFDEIKNFFSIKLLTEVKNIEEIKEQNQKFHFLKNYLTKYDSIKININESIFQNFFILTKNNEINFIIKINPVFLDFFSFYIETEIYSLKIEEIIKQIITNYNNYIFKEEIYILKNLNPVDWTFFYKKFYSIFPENIKIIIERINFFNQENVNFKEIEKNILKFFSIIKIKKNIYIFLKSIITQNNIKKIIYNENIYIPLKKFKKINKIGNKYKIITSLFKKYINPIKEILNKYFFLEIKSQYDESKKNIIFEIKNFYIFYGIIQKFLNLYQNYPLFKEAINYIAKNNFLSEKEKNKLLQKILSFLIKNSYNNLKEIFIFFDNLNLKIFLSMIKNNKKYWKIETDSITIKPTIKTFNNYNIILFFFLLENIKNFGYNKIFNNFNEIIEMFKDKNKKKNIFKNKIIYNMDLIFVNGKLYILEKKQNIKIPVSFSSIMFI